MSKRKKSQPKTLFPTAAELDVPPVHAFDGDVSRIRVFSDPHDPEWIAYAARRATRKAKHDLIEASVADLELGAAL